MNLSRFIPAVLAAAVLAAAAGCGTFTDDKGRPLSKKFAVEISNLDWMEVVYFPRPDDPVFKMPCKLSLMGSGEIEVRMGRSPRVWDSFSGKVDDPHWNEIYIDRWHAGQTEMQKIYQNFVDEGIVARFPRQAMQKEFGVPNVRVNARIGKERVIRKTDDPRLVGIVERVLLNFEGLARESFASVGKDNPRPDIRK